MSIRYWIAATAFGLTALVANPHDNWAQESNQTRGEEIRVPLPEFGLIDQSNKSDNLTKPCEAESDERDSDLCAQWKAADAAKKSADWSVYLGLPGIFIGILTLAAACAAAVFAKSAASATWETVEATKEIGEAQTRAYLHCVSARYRLAKDSVTAILGIENIGNSPAVKVQIIGNVTKHDVIGRPSHTRVAGWVSSRTNNSPCQPVVTKGNTSEDITFFWGTDFLTNTEDDASAKRAVFEGGNVIWFDLTIEYFDVFGKRNSVPLSLEAIIDAHPLNQKKKRARTGRLDIRIEDGRIHADRAYQPAND